MNKYQACQHYHEANGFLQAKEEEEIQENKEKLILYAQTCVLNKLTQPISQEILNLLDNATVNHLLQTDCSNSDEMEEAIQALSDPEVLKEIKEWYRKNKHVTQ